MTNVPEPIETKKVWESKTNWVALVVAVAAFFPPVQAWIATNPDTFSQVVAGLFFILRMITKDKVVIK